MFFTSKAVLIERLDTATRDKEYWRERAEMLESRLTQEQERNRKREEYLFNIAIVKRLEVSAIPATDDANEVQAKSPSVYSNLDEIPEWFRDMANESGVVNDYLIRQRWEANKHIYSETGLQ